MTFRLAFPLPGPIETADFTNVEDGVVAVDIGDDPELQRSFTLMLSLYPMPGNIPAAMQLSFWIADYDPASQVIFKWWHGNETKMIIPDPIHRGVLVFLLTSGAARLAGHFRPASIMIQTMVADLPQSAIVKYTRICDAIAEVGYECEEMEPYHGRRAWLLKRL